MLRRFAPATLADIVRWDEAHARNVRLIGKSRKKNDRLDPQTLARLARIDPENLATIHVHAMS